MTKTLAVVDVVVIPTLPLSLVHVIVPTDVVPVTVIEATVAPSISICVFDNDGVDILYVYGSDSDLISISFIVTTLAAYHNIFMKIYKCMFAL